MFPKSAKDDPMKESKGKAKIKTLKANVSQPSLKGLTGAAQPKPKGR